MKPSGRAWLLFALTVLLALLLASLAIATNLATGLVPDDVDWVHRPAFMWAAVGLLTVAVAVVSGIQYYLGARASTPQRPAPAPATVVLDAALTSRLSETLRVSNLPPRNPYYTERQEASKYIREGLSAPAAVVAVHGLGGVGKSALALAYAHEAFEEGRYDVAWWIRGDSPLTIAEDLAALAPGLDVATVVDQDSTVDTVRRELTRRDRWLLIFDNAPDAAAVRSWLPRGRGHTIVTSRDTGWGNLATRFGLDVFTREDSIRYLSRRGGQGQAGAADLAEVLGDLPLAVAQAASYLETHGELSVAGYLRRYRDRSQSAGLLAAGLEGYPHSVATTWLIHLDALILQPAALQLLRLAAHLDPDRIDVNLLLSRPELLSGPLTGALGRSAADSAVLDRLCQTGLVTRLEKDTDIRMHRLVALVTRHQADATRRSSWTFRRGTDTAWAAHAVSVVDALFPPESQLPADRLMAASLVPHALIAAGHLTDGDPGAVAAAHLLARVGAHLALRGKFDDAADALGRALAINEHRYGLDHPTVAITLNDLGSVQHDSGQVEEAFATLQRALLIKEAEFGPYHPTVAVTLTNLGNVLQDLGRAQEALDSLTRAFEIKKSLYGDDHLEVAYTLTTLGLVQQRVGDQAGGLASLRRALWIEETIFVPDDPRLAITLNNLGTLLHHSGQPELAIDHLSRALRINTAAYGADHPRVAITLTSLGVAQQEAGRADEALTNLHQALSIKHTAYGPDTPQVAVALVALAGAQEAVGQPADAEAGLRRASRIYLAAYGPDHPDSRRIEKVLSRFRRPPGSSDVGAASQK